MLLAALLAMLVIFISGGFNPMFIALMVVLGFFDTVLIIGMQKNFKPRKNQLINRLNEFDKLKEEYLSEVQKEVKDKLKEVEISTSPLDDPVVSKKAEDVVTFIDDSLNKGTTFTKK